MALSNTAVPIEYGKFRDAVLRGEIAVNYEISLQMNRIDYLINSKEYYYDDSAINGFISFCEKELTLSNGGDLSLLPTFKLWAEDALAWFYFVDEKVYNPKTKRYEIVTVKKRLCNKQYLIISRGAAKSMYAACLQAYFVSVDPETTHQIVTAPTMIQAEETLGPIRTALAIKRGPLFRYMTKGSVMSKSDDKVKMASTKKGIQNFVTNSLVEVRTMSINKLQGARPKLCTVDEWLSGDIREDVIEALEQGASKINDYLIVATSSEGTVRNGVGDTIKMELQNILRGDHFAPHISIWHYKLDDISEVGNPECWIKANPNLGATISYSEYEKAVQTMENVPSKKNDILAKRFGIPVEGLSYFFKYEDTLLHEPHNFDGLPCSLGADLSQGDDFCAFTFLFPLGNGRFGVKARSYISRFKLEKVTKAMKMKYEELISEGTLIVLNGYKLDMEEVYEDLYRFIGFHKYSIYTMGYDVYNSENFIKRWNMDFSDYNVEIVRQGFRTESVPLGEIQNAAASRMLIFDEELMKFAMGNSIVLEDINGNIMLSKKRYQDKIDNVSALMDAWVAYNRHQEEF